MNLRFMSRSILDGQKLILTNSSFGINGIALWPKYLRAVWAGMQPGGL